MQYRIKTFIFEMLGINVLSCVLADFISIMINLIGDIYHI